MIRIVLIEDDDLMREWLGRSLSSRGHEVVRYRRADEAIKAVVADPPDVVLSDVHMPGMSGLEFGRALIEHRVATPLLLMTADPTEALADHAEEAGARALLRKPFGSVGELWSAVETAAASTRRTFGEDLTNASHELRTPITAVRMALAGLVEERAMDASEQRLVEIATRNLDRLTKALEEHLARLALAGEQRSPAD